MELVRIAQQPGIVLAGREPGNGTIPAARAVDNTTVIAGSGVVLEFAAYMTANPA